MAAVLRYLAFFFPKLIWVFRSWCSPVDLADFIHCSIADSLYDGWRSLLVLVDLQYYRIWFAEWCVHFLPFCFDYFYVDIADVDDTTFELSDAIEYILRPLKAIRFPVHEISLMLSIALRFVPTLMDETEKIMNAQRARGVDFGEGGLLQKMKAIVPLLIPLFVSSFNRAEDLATAMEARGYQGGEGRTKYRILHWHNRDTLVVLVFVLFTVGLVLLRG